jgi:hypothetical protein
MRHAGRTFLIVAAGGRPLAVYRGLPKPERMVRASEGDTLVYDLGRLSSADHARLLDALAVFRELPFLLAEGAPAPLLVVGGEPFMRVGEDGKEIRAGLGGRLLDLLRST